jgi:hypothetical protein
MCAYQIDMIGGNCPVQAEGRIGGKTRFYFRARGDSWSMSIGGRDVVGMPAWYYAEPYGTWPDAGYMPEDEARAFIDKAIAMYWAQKRKAA